MLTAVIIVHPLRLIPLAMLAFSMLAPAEPVRVLIVDGFGNHDWRTTTKLLRGILAKQRGFDVTVSTAPGNDGDAASWNPVFSGHHVVIQTCNDINRSGPMWPEHARKGLEEFVLAGGGLFVFHSGNNAFPGWDAYNRMIGLGWRGRDFGSAIRIRGDGSLERIPPGEGKGTSHGPRTDRTIHRLGDHEIHAGLPRVWMTPLIEVYTHARGPAENLEVLSWAEDPATRERWPIEWSTTYGKGRVYTSTFGHVWKDETDPVNLRCAGFQTLIERALLWLAKRPVPSEVPADFPSAGKISLRPLANP